MKDTRPNLSHAISKATAALLATGARAATVYLSEKVTVRVSRRMFKTKKRVRHGRATSVVRRFNRDVLDLVVTVGRPNHDARAFIKRAKAAGEPFPVKKVQLSFPKS